MRLTIIQGHFTVNNFGLIIHSLSNFSDSGAYLKALCRIKKIESVDL